MRDVFRILPLLIFLIQSPAVVWSQVSKEIVMLEGRKYYLHEVKQGETIASICSLYDIEREELLTVNSELLYGIKVGEIIKIPDVDDASSSQKKKDRRKSRRKRKSDKYELEPTDDFLFHTVTSGETVFSLAKKYNVAVDQIYSLNPEAKQGILKGEILRIPKIRKEASLEKRTGEEVAGLLFHKVSPGETLYSISRKYDRPVSEILAMNPKAAEVLSVGQLLKISKGDETERMEEAISDSDFFFHRIEKGETFFRLEREYGTTAEELKKLNPALADGLKAGLTIKIPKVKIPEEKVEPIDGTKFFYHEVKKGETLYALATNYKVKIRDLKEINPVLKRRELVAGEKLLIPKTELIKVPVSVDEHAEKKVEVPGEIRKLVKVEAPVPVLPEECKHYYETNPDTFKVALFLPFYLNANDTINRVRIKPDEEELKNWQMLHANDTASFPVQFEMREEKIVYAKSRNFLNFYEGFLLAVDSLKKTGLEVELYVYDTDQAPKVIDSLEHLPEFLSLDLIVGPVYSNLQSTIAELAYKNRIPMVSPLAENGEVLKKNPYYFQIKPDKNCRIVESAKFISDEFFDANFIVLTNGNWKHLEEAKLVDLCREKLFSTGFYDEAYEPLFQQIDLEKDGFFGLEHVMDPIRENVVIVPSSSEVQVNVAVSNLNSLAERFKITLVGLHEYVGFRSISSENLHHLNMYFLSPYYVDYQETIVNDFIDTYRKAFYTEPNQFSFQGYDVAFYFLSALRQYGKRFVDCLPYVKVDLLQAEYNFQRASQFGGFMNTSLHIMNYNRSYTIQCDGKIGNTPVYFIDKNVIGDHSVEIGKGLDSLSISPLQGNMN